DPGIHLLAEDAVAPRTRPRVAEAECQRIAELSRLERRVQRLVHELAVETEIAGDDQRGFVVLEPRQSVDDRAQRDVIGARRGRRADREGERPDHARQHDLLGRRRGARRIHPSDRDPLVSEASRGAGDAEAHLRPPAATRSRSCALITYIERMSTTTRNGLRGRDWSSRRY